jgi:hypothetical protein
VMQPTKPIRAQKLGEATFLFLSPPTMDPVALKITKQIKIQYVEAIVVGMIALDWAWHVIIYMCRKV